MRLLIVTAAIAALSFPAYAQQRQQPQQTPRQQPPQQQQQPQQTQQDQPAPGMWACRTEQEVCFVAIVLGANQVSVLYTNDPKAENLEQKPVAVMAPSGAPAELGQHNGKVVMLTGEYTGQALTKAEVIDVASPLLSFAIKSMLSGNNDDDEEPEEPPQQPQRQPQRQQPQRR